MPTELDAIALASYYNKPFCVVSDDGKMRVLPRSTAKSWGSRILETVHPCRDSYR